MPFSLNSYLLGVGTVVGALLFGFGGGVFLSNTAMKDSPSGQTRIERTVRSEPPASAAPQVATAAVTSPKEIVAENVAPPVATARENPAAPAAQAPAANTDQAPAAQAPAVQPVAAAQTETPKGDAPKEAERVKQAAPVPPAEPATQPAQAKLTEPAKQTEPREAEQTRTVERKPERQKRYADRRFRETTVVRTRPQRLEVVDEPEVVSEPQERHFDLFKMPGLFGRPDDRDE
jgi:hypothetical protein